MIDSKRKREIKDLVDQIHGKAEKFQLGHVVFACNQFFRDQYIAESSVAQKKQEKQGLINLRKKKSPNAPSTSDEEDASSLGKSASQRVRVDVEYYGGGEGATSRLIKYEDRFVIEIPEILGKGCLPVKGQYDLRAINRLRRKMAHELGHAVLHSSCMKYAMQGSESLSPSAECEANYFADELITLRNRRRVALRNVGDNDGCPHR